MAAAPLDRLLAGGPELCIDKAAIHTINTILERVACMTDFSDKSDAQIEQWIKNHETNGAINVPLYRDLLEERALRGQKKSNLKVDFSLNLLRQAAIEQRCISYSDLAKGSGIAWSKARYRMNGPRGHLDQLLDVCHARGLPLLSALCVNQNSVERGELEETALHGFAEGARRLGFSVTNEREFHQECRDKCWEWGKTASTVQPK